MDPRFADWPVRVIRLIAKVGFRLPDHSSTKLYDAIVDAGAYVSILPRYLFRSKKKLGLTVLAPLVYKVALQCFLEEFRDKRKNNDLVMARWTEFLSLDNLENALLKASLENKVAQASRL
jgi:hypothetical protein